MRPFRPLPFTSFKGTPSSRANLRTDGDAWGKPSVASPGACAGACVRTALVEMLAGASTGSARTGAEVAAGADAGATGAAVGAALAVATLPSRITTKSPILTLSPSLTLISLTKPAEADGISIDALSLSTVIRLCSTFTVSPTFTSSSMTATSLKSPMSGMRTSIGPTATGAGAATGTAAGDAGATETGAARAGDTWATA